MTVFDTPTSDEIERTVRRGAKIVKGECSNCPFLRLYSYPVCYCLHAVVDYSSLCPYDYVIDRARVFYDNNIETIRYWDELTKKILFKGLILC